MTLTNRLGLDYRDDGDQNWGPAHRNVRLMLDRLLCPQAVFYVSPEYTAANLHLSGTPEGRRHFDTIQGAITAWEAGGHGSGNFGCIFVYPGRYEERLVVTKSVALVGTHGAALEAGLGGRGPYLLGTTAAPGSLITFTPPAGETHVVVFKNLNLRNGSAAAGSEVSSATPMVLQTVDQGSGNYGAFRSVVQIEDCNLRLDGGNANSWARGVNVSAHHWVGFRRCRMTWPGAEGSHRVRIPLYIGGNSGTGRWGHLSIKECEINHPTFSEPVNFTIDRAGASATGLVARSSFNRSRAEAVVNASGVTGMANDSQLAAYGNLVGVNLVEW